MRFQKISTQLNFKDPFHEVDFYYTYFHQDTTIHKMNNVITYNSKGKVIKISYTRKEFQLDNTVKETIQEKNLLDVKDLIINISDEFYAVAYNLKSLDSFNRSKFLGIFIDIKNIILKLYKVLYHNHIKNYKLLLELSHEIATLSYSIARLDNFPIYKLPNIIKQKGNQLIKYSNDLKSIPMESIFSANQENFSPQDTKDIIYPLCQHFHRFFQRECSEGSGAYIFDSANIQLLPESLDNNFDDLVQEVDLQKLIDLIDSKFVYSGNILLNSKIDEKIIRFNEIKQYKLNYKIIFIINKIALEEIPNIEYFKHFEVSYSILEYINFVEKNRYNLCKIYEPVINVLLDFKDEISKP